MRFLPTRVHGALDYLMGVLLIASPWLFGFAGVADGAATWLPVILGLVRKIPMPVHLVLDLGRGSSSPSRRGSSASRSGCGSRTSYSESSRSARRW